MTHLPRRVLAIAAAVAAALLPIQAQAAVPAAEPGGQGAKSYIVTLEPGADTPAAIRRHGVAPTHRYERVLNGFAAPLTPKQVAALRADAAVTRVEADGVATIVATQVNPPSWGLDRIDQRNLPLNNQYTFNATAPSVHAYIIDTGIDTGHSDFEGRASQVVNTVGGPNRDCNGHGTHVAGTVGAESYGVAKDVSLYGVKVLNCAGSGSWSSVIAGMDWVAANHTKPAVANLSLGGGFNASVNNALNNLAASGVFVAAAAGNSGADACSFSPASASNSTTVMASSSSDQRASFSNFGSCTHLYAPGVAITSTTLRNGTATLNGTSMAAPHVTGVAAMYKATFGDASYSTVRTWLINNSTTGVISGNPSGTPNRLLYTNGL
jgi:subtilisin family serine protease